MSTQQDPGCLFCKIARKEIPCGLEYEDKEVLAFRDINPQAPVHILIIPKVHIAKIDDMNENDQALVGKLVWTARRIASEKKVKEGSYRLVFNNGAFAGQSVFHIHLHLLAGRAMTWPPG